MVAGPRCRSCTGRLRFDRAGRWFRCRCDPPPCVLQDGEWVINGSKAFITNCGTPITSLTTVTARTERGISAIVLPAGTPGFVVEPAYHKLGWHASDTHGITLDDCRVPEANLLG